MPGCAPSDQSSRTPRPPPASFTSKNVQPLRARPAKLRVPRLLAAPRYRNGCAVLLGRAWLRSAVATERSNERGVAAQRFAEARGAVENKIQAAPVLRTDAWHRNVGRDFSRLPLRAHRPRLRERFSPCAREKGAGRNGCFRVELQSGGSEQRSQHLAGPRGRTGLLGASSPACRISSCLVLPLPGGLGLRCAVHHAPAAFSAPWADSHIRLNGGKRGLA